MVYDDWSYLPKTKVKCGTQELQPSWIADAGKSTLQSVNKNIYPGNTVRQPCLRCRYLFVPHTYSQGNKYPQDFTGLATNWDYYPEITGHCGESSPFFAEPIIVGGGSWYDKATKGMYNFLFYLDLNADMSFIIDGAADPGLYRVISGGYATDNANPCTVYLEYCGTVYVDKANHLAPCIIE